MATSTTRIFKSGNSLAVRIPKDMTPDEVPEEAEIEWRNGVWTIRPLHRRTLAGLMDRFKAFSPEFMAGGREFHEQKERDWGDLRDDGSPPAKPTSTTDDAERT
jgi:antitoxin VapB